MSTLKAQLRRNGLELVVDHSLGEPAYSVVALKSAASCNTSYVANKLWAAGEREKWNPKRQKKLRAKAPRIPDSRSSSAADGESVKSASEST